MTPPIFPPPTSKPASLPLPDPSVAPPDPDLKSAGFDWWLRWTTQDRFISSRNIQRHERIDLKGDPRHGTLYFIRQIHETSKEVDEPIDQLAHKAEREIISPKQDLLEKKRQRVEKIQALLSSVQSSFVSRFLNGSNITALKEMIKESRREIGKLEEEIEKGKKQIGEWRLNNFSHRMGTALYQFLILRELYRFAVEQGIRHLFDEGALPGTWSLLPLQQALIDETFGGALPEEPDGFQLTLLYSFGSTVVFKGIIPQITLHGASGSLDLEAHETMRARFLHSIDKKDEEEQKMILAELEKIPAQKLAAFFKKNRGAKAILVFGAAHEFCDDFKRMNWKGRIVSIWWDIPGLEKKRFGLSMPPPGCETK